MRSNNGLNWLGRLLAGGLFALLAGAALAGSVAVTEGSKAAGLSACVADTDQMRRNHMDFLKHGRDDVVHKGVRDQKYRIAECVDCHAAKDAQGKPIPVNDPGQFCAGCHEYTAVHLDCFGCHRKVPEEQPPAGHPTGVKTHE
jgi:predicted CXXCH cytochrome family protein